MYLCILWIAISCTAMRRLGEGCKAVCVQYAENIHGENLEAFHSDAHLICCWICVGLFLCPEYVMCLGSFYTERPFLGNTQRVWIYSWTIYLCRIQWKTSLWYTFMWLDYNFSAAWFETLSPSCTHRWTMQKSTPYD